MAEIDVATAKKVAIAVAKLDICCIRAGAKLQMWYPDVDKYLVEEYREKITVTVHGGRFLGRIKFWSLNALIVYLIDPAISFRICAIHIISENPQYVSRGKGVITLAGLAYVGDIIRLTGNRVVILYEHLIWHNCCYMLFPADKKTMLIDKFISPETMNDILSECRTRDKYTKLFFLRAKRRRHLKRTREKTKYGRRQTRPTHRGN